MSSLRRWITLAAKALAGLVLFIALGLGALLAYESVDREDGFFVQRAALLDPSYLITIESWKRQPTDFYEPTGVGAHRLKSGDGTIFAHRFYSNGDVFSADDEIFEKVTIWVAENVRENAFSTRLGDEGSVRVVYTRGGSAWPESSCSGFISSGVLRIAPSSRGFSVAISGGFEPRGNRAPNDGCNLKHVDLSFEATELKLSQLTPWLGREGAHPYEETHRN